MRSYILRSWASGTSPLGGIQADDGIASNDLSGMDRPARDRDCVSSLQNHLPTFHHHSTSKSPHTKRTNAIA